MTIVENLPPSLPNHTVFGGYRTVIDKEGKAARVPINPKTNLAAKSNDYETFGTFDEAVANLGNVEGMTLLISKTMPRSGPTFVALDLDHCIDDAGGMTTVGRDALAWMPNVYAERSPSGHGLRILLLIDEAFKYDVADFYIMSHRTGVEVYVAGVTDKYLTVTGDTLTPGADLVDCTEGFKKFVEKYAKRPRKQITIWDGPGTTILTDAEVLKKAMSAKNKDLFCRLWNGDITGYESASEARQALLWLLAFWCCRDPEQMDRLFRQSGLYDEKWERPQRGTTYGDIEIQSAIDDVLEIYEPKAGLKNDIAKIDTSGSAQPEAKSKLKILSLSAFEPRRVDYLFEPYIPKASLTIYAGQSGAGKTFALLRHAADVTRGRTFMTDNILTPDRKPQKVLYQSRENDFNTVIRPRFEMMGGDLENFITIDDHDTDGKGAPLSMVDPRLEEAIAVYRPALVVLDPIQSYLGAGVDMHRANEVRPILDRIIDLAVRFDTAFVVVAHLSKQTTASALDRIVGTMDFRAAARSIVMVGKSPFDENLHVMAHAKFNNGKYGRSIGFRINGKDGVVFEDFNDYTPDEIVAHHQQTRNKPSVTLDKSVEFLSGELVGQGWQVLDDIKTAAEDAGHSMATIYRAKTQLQLQSFQVGFADQKTAIWALPDSDVEAIKNGLQLQHLLGK